MTEEADGSATGDVPVAEIRRHRIRPVTNPLLRGLALDGSLDSGLAWDWVALLRLYGIHNDATTHRLSSHNGPCGIGNDPPVGGERRRSGKHPQQLRLVAGLVVTVGEHQEGRGRTKTEEKGRQTWAE